MGSTLVGSTLGRFRVDRLLGRGGMGAVYAAFDEKLERDVALKVLIEEGDVALQTKRLMREARLAAKLTHPNIATIYEVDEIDGRLVIVMELLDGHPLRKILTQRKMEMEEAIAIGRDMARALARAHAAGVIHRDIKPENVFVTTPSPETLLAKVLDFGLARQKPTQVPGGGTIEATSVTNTTSQGNMWGTPGYVSPEQAHGQVVDVRTDIFSFGVVFYEMLANIKPFRGENAIQLMVATTRVEARPLREIVPALAPEVEDIIRRCMRKNKEERYADGSELSSALEGFFRGAMSAKMMGTGSHSPVSSSTRLPILGPDDLKSEPADSSHSPTTGGSAAIEITARDGGIQSLEQQRRDQMKLLVAIASGIGVAVVVVVIALWTSSRRRHSELDPPVVASQSTTLNPPATTVEPPPPPPSAPPTEIVAPPPPPPSVATAVAPSETTPVPTAPVAPTAATGHAGGAGSGHHPPRPKKPDCTQPFIIDSKGVKIPKMQCL